MEFNYVTLQSEQCRVFSQEPNKIVFLIDLNETKKNVYISCLMLIKSEMPQQSCQVYEENKKIGINK